MVQSSKSNSAEGGWDLVSLPEAPLICILLIGRGSRGKSFLTRMIVEYLATRTTQPAKKVSVVDGDRTNPTTSTHIPHAIRPEAADEVNYRPWVRQVLCMPRAEDAHVIIDLGASADNTVKQIVYDLDLVSFFKGQNVTFVLIHCIGPDLADLAYIEAFEANMSGPESRQVLAPTATIVAINAGVARGSGDSRSDFKTILEDECITTLRERGAQVLTIPFLSHMRTIEEGRHTIAKAMDAALPKDEKLRLNAMDQFEVSEWWKGLTKQFDTISALGWLP